MVHVHFCEGKEKHNAIFCAKETEDGPTRKFGMEIPQKLYEILLEYTKLGNPDLILILHVEGNDFQWGLTSESWLRHHSYGTDIKRYVV